MTERIDYIDSSAYLKLLVEEPQSVALSATMEQRRAAGNRVVSSILLVTELRRAAHRYGIPLNAVDDELTKIDIISADDSTFLRAGTFPDPGLRSLDALHLAAALDCGATAIVTYDARQIATAPTLGIAVLSPV